MPWPLSHQRTEVLEAHPEWAGFVGVDNIDAIFERVKKIVVPGRSFTIIRTDSDVLRNPPRVDQGATLYMGKAYREPLECKKDDSHGWISANMGPRLLGGFGMGYGWVFEDMTTRPMTGKEVRERVYTDRIIGGKNYGPDKFDWSHVTIHGGVEGYRQGQDRITIIRENENGYREMIDVVPCDIAWQQRYERDALTLDQAVERLQESKASVDEFHPCHGISDADAFTAIAVLERMTMNLRKWQEPLAKHEAFPVVKEM